MNGYKAPGSVMDQVLEKESSPKKIERNKTNINIDTKTRKDHSAPDGYRYRPLRMPKSTAKLYDMRK